MNGGHISIEFHSKQMGPSPQIYVVLRLEHMGPSLCIYTKNRWPILLMIYIVTLRAYGPIHIELCSEGWAHTLNDICYYAWSKWAHL
jgi:hypothetical protein